MKGRENSLDQINEEELLKTRLCDLPLVIKGTWLEECVHQLYTELDAADLLFHPVCYLADEWLTPEGETCIGIPFYLAHPVLINLEKKYMFEAEGEGRAWCMKLLRHELGHAICYAYRLNRRETWRKTFGSSLEEYGKAVKYRPYSKNYVHHLDGYYAQYHPDEDFVETFAVWITPGVNWREQYKGWPALKKLMYVDGLMREIKGKKPLVKSSQKFWRLSTLRYTLEQYYRRKRSEWEEDFPEFHDEYLQKNFATPQEWLIPFKSVAELLHNHRQEVLDTVARTTGARKYVISGILKGMTTRSRNLKLMYSKEHTALLQLVSYVTALTMNYQHTGRFRNKKRKIA